MQLLSDISLQAVVLEAITLLAALVLPEVVEAAQPTALVVLRIDLLAVLAPVTMEEASNQAG
jgi:hypothetical protein